MIRKKGIMNRFLASLLFSVFSITIANAQDFGTKHYKSLQLDTPLVVTSGGIGNASGDVSGLNLAGNSLSQLLPLYSPVVYPNFGGDMGAKINSAIATCLATGCIVDARGLKGAQTLSTAVSVPANVSVLIGAARITQSATVTLAGEASSLVCIPVGFGQGNASGSYFKMAVGANLQNMLMISGGNVSAANCAFDGNDQGWEGNNNPSAGPLVAVVTGHFLLEHLTAQNGASDGFMIYSGPSQGASGTSAYSYGTANTACCGTIRDSVAVKNGGDGFNCGGTADVIFEGSQVENNLGAAGIELNNCPAWRFTNYDIGGNQIGLWAHGAAWASGVSLGAGNNMIGTGQFGNNAKQDIIFDSSADGSNWNVVVGTEFFASSNRTSNTYPNIEIIENGNGYNLISSVYVGSTAAHTSTSAIYIHGATTGHDTIGPIMAVGTFGGTVFNVPSGAALTSACYNGNCTTSGQTFPNLNVIGTGSGYALTASTKGVSGADAYPLAISNPSNDPYASIAEDAFVGNPGILMHQKYCQRMNGASTGTCAYYANQNGVKMMYDLDGGTPPALTGCGILAGSPKGFITVGQFTLNGACAASTITLTFPWAATNGWNCPDLSDQTNHTKFPQQSSTTTSATFLGTGANSDVLTYGKCFPY